MNRARSLLRRWRRVVLPAILATTLVARAGAADFLHAKPSHYCNDAAGILKPETVQKIDRALEGFESLSSNQVVVAIYPKLRATATMEEYCQRLAASWRIGQRGGRDNGVVLFYFARENRFYIEVGRGLQGVLPDAACQRIITDRILPWARANDLDGAIDHGTAAILAATENVFQGDQQHVYWPRPIYESRLWRFRDYLSPFFLLSIVFYLISFPVMGLWNLVAHREKRRATTLSSFPTGRSTVGSSPAKQPGALRLAAVAERRGDVAAVGREAKTAPREAAQPVVARRPAVTVQHEKSVFLPKLWVSVRQRASSPRWRLASALLVLTSGGLLVWDQTKEVIPPRPGKYFNDYAHLLKFLPTIRLGQDLYEYDKTTSNQFLVVIYPRLRTHASLEDYCHRATASWHLGFSGRDNGAVLFYFVKEKQVYLEVLPGLQKVLPKAKRREIIDQIAPQLRGGDYEQGFRQGISGVCANASLAGYQGNGKPSYEFASIDMRYSPEQSARDLARYRRNDLLEFGLILCSVVGLITWGVRANWDIFSENGKKVAPPPIWKIVAGVLGAILLLGVVIVLHNLVAIVGLLLSGGLFGIIGLLLGLGGAAAGGAVLFGGGGGASGDW